MRLGQLHPNIVSNIAIKIDGKPIRIRYVEIDEQWLDIGHGDSEVRVEQLQSGVVDESRVTGEGEAECG